MDKIDEAVKCFNEGFNCSQAILSTYSDKFGLDKKTALMISCGFGGGMGRMAETCGAVTGAFMLIGLKCGKHTADDNVSKEKTFTLMQDFVQRFTSINGSIKCKELLKYDISTPQGMKSANEENLWDTQCSKFVRDSAKIIEEMLI